jgi:hypothetical protein
MEREGFSEEEITWQFAFRMALSVLAIGRRVPWAFIIIIINLPHFRNLFSLI